MRARLVAVVASSLVLATAPARAQSAPAPAPASIPFLRAALARDESPSRTWFIGWTSFYTLATAAQAIVAASSSNAGIRADARVGAVESALGFVAILALPPAALRAPAFLPPNASPDERAAWVAAEAEHLRAAAEQERLAHSWVAHAAAIVVCGGGSAFLWLHDDRPVSAIVSFVSGVAVSELQIFTRPRQAIADEETWRLTVAPSLSPSGASLGATMRF